MTNVLARHQPGRAARRVRWRDGLDNTFRRTLATPSFNISNRPAARGDRSITRWYFLPKLPVSLILTTTDLWLPRLVMRTLVPSGRELCAAVNRCSLNISPLFVRFPANPGPYQEAIPTWVSWPAARAGELPANNSAAIKVRTSTPITCLNGTYKSF